MRQRWRSWAPVLVVALGFAVLAWLVASASLSGHQLATPGVPPAGVPPKAVEYLPKELLDDFPDDVDLATDSAKDLPPGLLDYLEEELSSGDLAELSHVLSDDLLIELAKRDAADLSPGQIQKLYDGLDPETRQRLLDEIGGQFTQEDIDRFRDRLTPELYEELSDRAESEADPAKTPGEESTPETEQPTSGDTEPSAEASASEPAESSAQPSAKDEAADTENDGPPQWLRDLGESVLFALKWLVILGLIALAGYLLFRVVAALAGWRPRSRDRSRTVAAQTKPDEPEPEVDKLREAVAEGRADIEDAADPRRGVIVCWQRLERAAAAAGLARQASETPGELVARVMAAAKVDPEALNGLADAYRSARYGPHAIGEDLRQQAVGALAAVDAQLAAAHAAKPRETV